MDNKQDKGFTLVELLIVIVILGILATVTVFAVRGITERSQENACDVELRALETAVEAYYVDNDQVFPTTLASARVGWLRQDARRTAGIWSVSGGNTPSSSSRLCRAASAPDSSLTSHQS